MQIRRTGDWFTTFSGKKYFLTDPHPDDVCIGDIAHALSLVCRFGGHCKQSYSVGNHSLLCCDVARDRYPNDSLLQMHVLLHDASEAYIGDVVRPLKRSMPQYLTLEERTMAVIYEALKLPMPTAEHHDIIKTIDNELLMAERRDLINHSGHVWDIDEEPWEGNVSPLSASTVELHFRFCYARLRREVS